VIKPGEWHEARVWGRFHINKVAELPQPVIFDTARWGPRTSFRPVIAEIEWQNGNKEFWFPYWIGPEGKERYAQYSPMMGEEELLALLREAMDQQFFGQVFLSQLAQAASQAISRNVDEPR